MADGMKAKHLGKALWSATGGVLMGAIAGLPPFWLLASAGMVMGTFGGFMMVAALPMIAFAYREGKEAYDKSRQTARKAELEKENEQYEKAYANGAAPALPVPAQEQAGTHYTDKIKMERMARAGMPAVSAASYRT